MCIRGLDAASSTFVHAIPSLQDAIVLPFIMSSNDDGNGKRFIRFLSVDKASLQIQWSALIIKTLPIADLSEEDVYNIVGLLKPYYKQGNRNDFTMYLAGLMRKEDMSFQSALKVIESIAADDEEKPARIRTLEETYKKQDLDRVCGYSGLFSILLNQTQNEDGAIQILDQVVSLFPGKQSKG